MPENESLQLEPIRAAMGELLRACSVPMHRRSVLRLERSKCWANSAQLREAEGSAFILKFFEIASYQRCPNLCHVPRSALT